MCAAFRLPSECQSLPIAQPCEQDVTTSVHQSAPSVNSSGKDAFLKGLGVVGEACADLLDTDRRLIA